MTKELKNRILENKVLTYDERMEIIKALEQQSTSDDCVSRQAVINLVNAECVDLQDGSEEWRSYVNETVENIYHGIKALPPVTPTFPKGTTNGDMIETIFPNLKGKEKAFAIHLYVNKDKVGEITAEWWNAPYGEK